MMNKKIGNFFLQLALLSFAFGSAQLTFYRSFYNGTYSCIVRSCETLGTTNHLFQIIFSYALFVVFLAISWYFYQKKDRNRKP